MPLQMPGEVASRISSALESWPKVHAFDAMKNCSMCRYCWPSTIIGEGQKLERKPKGWLRCQTKSSSGRPGSCIIDVGGSAVAFAPPLP